MSMMSAEVIEQSLLQVSVDVQPDGSITCSPDPLDVVGSNVTIVFSLTGSGCVFPPNGAVIVAGASTQFPQPVRTASSRVATLLDVNSLAGSFGYTVYAQHAVSGARVHLDPTIRNEG